uniref:Uncharacterized protein n=1 Tax=Arundo donax TaxID=35708 RepID=A0A0A9FG39_ARUDO
MSFEFWFNRLYYLCPKATGQVILANSSKGSKWLDPIVRPHAMHKQLSCISSTFLSHR